MLLLDRNVTAGQECYCWAPVLWNCVCSPDSISLCICSLTNLLISSLFGVHVCVCVCGTGERGEGAFFLLYLSPPK